MRINNFCYRDVAFNLRDSITGKRFCRIGLGDPGPSRSTLQANIALLNPETLETLNTALVNLAGEEGIEEGKRIRTDSTVTETTIHHPTDSSLLWDTVRALCHLMEKAAKAGARIKFSDCRKRAKTRALAVLNAKNAEAKTTAYKELLKAARGVIERAERALPALAGRAAEFAPEMKELAGLGKKVVSQTERRALRGETVPAEEKVVSLFESHTDIIVKSRRGTEFGHKVFLTAGKSGLVIDCAIERGNPADSSLAVPMTERAARIYGRPPEQASFDGRFASQENLAKIKELGVLDVCFSKKRGLEESSMVREPWIYKMLHNFRAGIEAVISYLKRCFGLGRCPDKGWTGFLRYVRSAVIACNLWTIARHKLKSA